MQNFVTFKIKNALQEKQQSWTLRRRKIHKIKQNRFFMKYFTNDFFVIFYQKKSKFDFGVAGWVLAITSEHFKDFLEISQFPKNLSLKSFGSSYIHFLVIIT